MSDPVERLDRLEWELENGTRVDPDDVAWLLAFVRSERKRVDEAVEAIENASLARQVESMAMRIESLAEELAKPEDVRLREVLDALDGRAVIFDGLGARVGHLLDEMDEWIGRAGEAERLAEERLAHANQLQADIEAEMQGRLALRKRLGAREDETMEAFLERLAAMAAVVPDDVHERGWQWRPTATDTAFAPPFGTIRQCRVCGCLVAGGPTVCARCAEDGA